MKKIINPWRRSAEGRLQGKNQEGYKSLGSYAIVYNIKCFIG